MNINIVSHEEENGTEWLPRKLAEVGVGVGGQTKTASPFYLPLNVFVSTNGGD